jgi:hypothetical protein
MNDRFDYGDGQVTVTQQNPEEILRNILSIYRNFGFEKSNQLSQSLGLNLYDILAKHHIKGGQLK